jgi:lysozyme family protein
MEPLEQYFNRVKTHGWSDDPNDMGGKTMVGVTCQVYFEYRKSKGLSLPTPSDLRNMTYTEWSDVLKSLFWNRWRADCIRSQSLANMLVDWVWGSGIYGIKIPQRILNISMDGIVGTQTIAAVNAQVPLTFFKQLEQEREAFYRRIVVTRPIQQMYLNGWLNRVRDIKFVG